ncbi:MAG: hypothetical protein M9905_15790 [Rhizobiaceae bacterium]|nr:hypothetical protein [Rhizobiaceae bacterium]
MNGISKMFFLTGAVFALVGMGWGIHMSASQDHLMAPAHGHLNLIGFVAMSVFGTFYALAPSTAGRLALFHYLLTVAAVIVLIPGIAIAISGSGEALAKIGSVLAILSMAVFGLVVLRSPAASSTSS